MASVIKQIKPSRLKADSLRLKLLSTMHKVEREMKKDFKDTTETWEEHDPKFESLVAMAPNGPEVMVWTDDEIYGYVNNGTPEHIITAKTKKAMTFNWDGYGTYVPKTTPNVIGSVQSSVAQNQVYFAAVVHPGTEARNFDKVIQEKWQPKFKDYCEQALREFKNESGHGVK